MANQEEKKSIVVTQLEQVVRAYPKPTKKVRRGKADTKKPEEEEE